MAELQGQGLARNAKQVKPAVAGLAIIVLLFVVAFFPSLEWMAGEWSGSSGVLSHGYLVAAISVVLFVRAVPDVARSDIQPNWWLLIVTLGFSITWLLGYVATVVAVQTIVLPAILYLAIAGSFGIRAARPVAFPIFFVCFALPAWEHLQFIFQAITVFVVGLLIRLADIPALLEGNFVRLAPGTFEIAGGCAGLAFVIAGLSLAVLYGHLFYRNIRHKIALMALVFGVAMLGNWIRVFLIIMIGYRSDMQSSLVDDHLTFGWIMFAILMVPVYWFASRLENDEHMAVDKHSDNSNPGSKLNWAAVGTATLAMIAGPAWAMTVSSAAFVDAQHEIQFPNRSNGWVGPVSSSWEWTPSFAGADVERVAQYSNGTDFVLVYANLYLVQEQGKELIYFANRIGGDWRVAELETQPASIVQLNSGDVFRQDVAKNYVGNWLIWSRYRVDGKFETSNVRAKVLQAFGTLVGEPQSATVAFATPCRESCTDAAVVLPDFAGQLGNDIRVIDSQEEL